MRFNLLLFVFTVILFAWPQHIIAAPMQTKAQEAYIIDFETGQVLFDKKSDAKMPTSSMSKVMTTIMAFDAIKSGDASMDTEFNVSEKASKKGGSKMFVAQGTNVALEDLLRGIIIQSGNDATIVVAEGLSGSEDAFARIMTKRAKEIGMENTNFVNASGWPDENHYSTAKDLTTMSLYLINNYPNFYKMFAEEEFEYAGIKQSNRNPLLNNKFSSDGIKTGHTEAGGYGLIGSAVKNDRRVVMVLNGMESKSERAAESQRLMQWALDSFVNKTLFSKGAILERAPVTMGKAEKIALSAPKDVKVTVPKVSVDKIKINAGFKSPLIAPIMAGDEVGAILIQVPNQEDIKIPLIAAETVEKAGFFSRYLSKIKYTILGAI